MKVINIQIPAGDDILRLPFAVNVRNMEDYQASTLLENISSTLGAQYFRDKDLLLDVLKDQKKAASEIRSFLPGPYAIVHPRENGTIRLSSFNEERIPGGFTVYSEDQINHLLEQIRADRNNEVGTDNSPSP